MNSIAVRASCAALCLSSFVSFGALAAPPTLPDSAVIARVNERVTRVEDFRARYYRGDPQTRPGQDSTGRVEFLETLINKDMLGITATKLGQPLSLENRIDLREFTNTTLAREYYLRRVEDPVKVKMADIKAIYPQYASELKLRCLLFDDLAVAQKVRLDLTGGKITWAAAAERYAGHDTLRAREFGWVNRTTFTGPNAATIWTLRPPAYSQPLRDADGYRIWQVLDKRAVEPPPFAGIRITLTQEVRATRQIPLRDQLFDEATRLAEARWDTANIVWLTDQFIAERNKASVAEGQTVLDLSSHIPKIAPADTGRALSSTHGRVLSVRGMLDNYRQTHPVMRRKILGLATLFDIVQRMTLEPEIVTMARKAGFESDPKVKRIIDERREGMLVDQMYSDSVSSHVRVDEKMRRAIYDKHKSAFHTEEKVRFATIPRGSEAGADSVIAQLRRGVRAQQIQLADSLGGLHYVAIRENTESEAGSFRDILFGELKQGEVTKLARTGGWVVIQLLERITERPQTYEEVVDILDDAARSQEEERLLAEWLDRLRPKFRIESHPERVMQFSLETRTPESVVPQD